MTPADWWIRWRDHDPVRTALVQSHCEFWVGIVDELLIRNEEQQQFPGDWQELAKAVLRNRKNLERWRGGKQFRYPPHDFLAMAGVLRIESSELIPNNLHWVAASARLMCKNGFTPEECRVFAACCLLQCGRDNIDVSPEIIATAMDRCGNQLDAERVTEVVSEILEILSRSFEELSEK